jgi:hypothetical protein
VSALFTVISAPATAAPVESVTVPWIPPRKVCAIMAAERQSMKNTEERVLIVD